MARGGSPTGPCRTSHLQVGDGGCNLPQCGAAGGTHSTARILPLRRWRLAAVSGAAAEAPACLHAGYRNSDVGLPRPGVTRRLQEFRLKGRSDSQAMQAMVDWANRQPDRDGEG